MSFLAKTKNHPLSQRQSRLAEIMQKFGKKRKLKRFFAESQLF